MQFNSIEYLIFFLLVLGASFLTVGIPKLRIWILLLASYYFYTSNNHWLICLILFSTQVDYFAAILIEKSQNNKFRKRLLAVSIIVNLGLLCFFKYFNFFSSSVVSLLSCLGMNVDWVDLNILLPVGISFYTFQSMSYTIDVYRGDIQAEHSWSRFSLFVAYFPQLVAGPIVRAQNFLPELNKRPYLTSPAFESALLLICSGMFKKMVLADFLSIYSDPVFSSPASTDWFQAWIGVYAFSMQIYYDFSGYSDIAIGCARLMGFELPDNFRRPYAAIGITDFWRRWHISLSTWLRDYLYIPLGGNRVKSRFLVYRNLMLTMLLGGLWHGAAWNFVIWGGLHGVGLVIERIWKEKNSFEGNERNPIFVFLKRLVTCHLIVLLWGVFRIESMDGMADLVHVLLNVTPDFFVSYGNLAVILIVIFSFLYQVAGESFRFRDHLLDLPLPIKAALYYSSIVCAVIFSSIGTIPFIYFQF